MLSNRLLYWLNHTVAVNPLMTLSIRLFAECSDDIEAAKLLFALCNALTAFSPRSASAPSRYWKIPELFEFYFALTPQSLDIFQQVIALTSTGWTHGGDNNDLWAVWNRQPEHTLLLPSVTWAEVQFFTH